MRSAIHYIPIATTLLAILFAPVVFRRWQARRQGPDSSIRVIPRATPMPLAEVRSTLLRPAGSDHGVSR